jgi:hypothetical protein
MSRSASNATESSPSSTAPDPVMVDDGDGTFEIERIRLSQDAVEEGQHLGI